MRTQAASIIACDLFTVETVRMKTLHVIFFVDLYTPRVLIGGVTDGATNVKWCTQIARNLSEARESRSTRLRFLVHDRDPRFGEPFDEVFKAEGVEIIRNPVASPEGKCLCRALGSHRVPRQNLCDQRAPPRVSVEDVHRSYNRERPHRGLNLRIPEGGPPPILADATGSIVRRDRLDGLIHEYHRKAA
jgi:putative transposase